MKNPKTPAHLPRKAPSNQTGGTAWGKKQAAEFSRMAQAADMKKLILLNFPYIRQNQPEHREVILSLIISGQTRGCPPICRIPVSC